MSADKIQPIEGAGSENFDLNASANERNYLQQEEIEIEEEIKNSATISDTLSEILQNQKEIAKRIRELKALTVEQILRFGQTESHTRNENLGEEKKIEKTGSAKKRKSTRTTNKKRKRTN